MTVRRIMLLATGLGIGGAEKQVVDIGTVLQRRGHHVLLVSMVPVGKMGEVAVQRRLAVESLHMRPGIPDPRGVWRLRALVDEWKPDVLHSHMVHANLLARVARLITRVPVLISTAHNTIEGGWWLERAYRLTDFLADVTTQISDAGVKEYVERRVVPANKLKFVPNGINVDGFQPDPDIRAAYRQKLHAEDAFVWLAVGRLEPQKDYPTLLRAFAQVRTQCPRSVLWIVGGGSLEDAIRDLIRKLRLEDDVLLLGERSDVAALMNGADGFVLSSAWEGFGLVLVEAMLTGLPIVATDSGGPREVLDDGRLGILVPIRDPDELAAAMVKVTAMPAETRQAMGEEGRRYAMDRYRLEKVVDRWEELYEELLSGR